MKNDNLDLFDEKFPPIHIQALNFTKALGRIILSILTLERIKATKITFKNRIGQCSECEYCINGKRCKLCGCFIKTKAKLLTEKCPADKW